ncbi:hypothetical protein KC353_g8877 [Hortaea werneckii]|nr:hypothetical protein KC353_g8877 [Hortaea werneckii]
MSSRPAAVGRRSAKTEYIETDTGNKISRRSHIEGKQNIMLGGKSVIMAGVCLRGDLYRKSERAATEGEKDAQTAISVGRRGQMTFYPIRISDNVFIGPESHISAASISSHVYIGAQCVLLPFCVVKEQCKILPGTVVPPHMIIPPGSVVAGRPARIVGEVGEGWGMQLGGGEGEEWVEGGDLRPLVRSIK